MHTAYDIKSEMFAIRCNGAQVARDDFLDWGLRDRFGLVVNAALGGLGAGLLTMLAITAFYDEPTRKRRKWPLYPDIYLFHVGGPWGSHGGFDFWPDRKDVQVSDDPTDVLRAINDRGITHLAVPDGTLQKTVHRYKEPEAALDRIKHCYAYAPSGSVAGADVVITADADGVLSNFETTLQPQIMLDYMAAEVDRNKSLRVGTVAGDDARRAMAYGRARLDEIDRNGPDYRAAAERLAAARDGAGLEERLRRIDVHTALELLGPARVVPS
ncbi:hypothetical protein GCM10009087_48740 [Sphingomonas oligophenolica]|uniref:PNPLA domain-containing protein n=1 Tax=Sphingomonas oligophenolica TaxID=301154 RepID=A0ABU9YBR4_9SPHN